MYRQNTANGLAVNLIIKLYESYTNARGESVVYLIVYLKGQRVRFHTGVLVTKDAWDAETLQVRSEHPNSKDLNLIISKCRALVTDIFVRYRLQHRDLTPRLLKDEYLRPSLSIDFLAFMEAEITRRSGELTPSSIQQHRAHLNKLREFAPSLAFSELTEDFFADYNRWLKSAIKKNNNNTRHNSLKTIRTYINIAKRRGLISDNPLKQMPVSRNNPHREFLTETELENLVAIYRSERLPDRYQRVLRHYLFSCFTGIRISDLRRIRMDDIISDTLVLSPYKTRNRHPVTIKIPLPKIALQLIHDESPYLVKGEIFTLYSEPRMRTYLKDVLQHAGIKRQMTFHSSRHTFATVFLRNTKNLAALQKLLGHTRIDQTMVYAHILTEDIEGEMKIWEKF